MRYIVVSYATSNVLLVNSHNKVCGILVSLLYNIAGIIIYFFHLCLLDLFLSKVKSDKVLKTRMID